ncbi:MAG: iron-sulfur cluster assembly protein, partial [Pacificimonas sp.]
MTQQRPTVAGPLDEFMDPALQSTNRKPSPAFDGPNRDRDAEQAEPARGKDYLEGFLKAEPNTPVRGAPGGELYEQIVETLREIYDPEIPVNIYDLGLIYGVEVNDDHAIVTMTLTTPH